MSERRKYETVLLDGRRYVPVNEEGPDAEAMKLLNDVFGSLWMEAYYDPTNDATRTFAAPLADKMSKLNSILGFKS